MNVNSVSGGETSMEQKPIRAVDAFARMNRPAPAAETNGEQESAFAKGLPSWDIVPPQVVVRRKRSR